MSTEISWPHGAPGSLQAEMNGCKCPKIDNQYGLGVPYSNGNRWYMSGDCPVHMEKMYADDDDEAGGTETKEGQP